MARFSRLQVLNAMVETGVVPVFYNANVDTAIKIVEACLAGGVKLIEFTNRGDLAFEVFTALAKHFAKTDVILGVGSVLDAGTAAIYINSGANFVVGPLAEPRGGQGLQPAQDRLLPRLRHAQRDFAGRRAGLRDHQGLSRRAVGGPDFVKSVLGPCPWVSIMPTGGVDATKESIDAWFKAGVVCVGIGTKLVRSDLVAAGDFAGITARAQQVLAWIKEARGK